MDTTASSRMVEMEAASGDDLREEGKNEYLVKVAERAGLNLESGFNQEGQDKEIDSQTQKAEQLLEEEMAKLSLEEHEKAVFRTVGFDETTTVDEREDAAVLNQKLMEMEEALEKISPRKKGALDLAMRSKASYVKQKKLDFLKYCALEPKRAAQRLVSHFAKKQELFGSSELLSRDILYDDLDDGTREFLDRGYWQISPSKDRAGRTVCCFGAGIKEYKSVESILKTVWYMNQIIARDEEFKKNGFIIVINTFGKVEDYRVFQALVPLQRFSEGQLKCLHVCQVTRATKFFMASTRFFYPTHINLITRDHSGDYQQITFALQTYGINTDDLPWQEDDSWSTNYHKKWLEMQKGFAKQNLASTFVITPSRKDVLFGKDAVCRENPGTLRCQHFVDIFYNEYDSAKEKDEKTVVANKIVEMIQMGGGRFLRREGDGWEEVTDLDARKKVAHFFRAKRERQKKATAAEKRKLDIDTSQQNVRNFLKPCANAVASYDPSPVGGVSFGQQPVSQVYTTPTVNQAAPFIPPQEEMLQIFDVSDGQINP
mmetsp:Transcript_889/g.2541  ORF Transcript_889/g.2541 Transcript_889/m.2541 type:complete len:543 (+) Transcript_889:104-1732(+)